MITWSKRRHQFVGVGSRAARDHPPLRPVVDREHAVILKKLHEIAGGELPHVVVACRPNRRPNRYDVLVHEFLRITVALKILAERRTWLMLIEQGHRLPIEPENVADHAIKRGTKQILSLGKECVKAGPVVFQSRALAFHAKAHIADLCFHTKPAQKFHEIRIGPVIKHDETGIHRIGLTGHIHVDRVGMASDIISSFKDRDLMVSVQQVRCDHPRNTGSHDGNFHDSTRNYQSG